MNADVIDHVVTKVKELMRLCHLGVLIHEGGREDAVRTYAAVIKTLESLK
jgi:hypothetical protein